MDSSLIVVPSALNMAPVLSKVFLDIQAAIECGFTLKCEHDIIKWYSQMHHRDK